MLRRIPALAVVVALSGCTSSASPISLSIPDNTVSVDTRCDDAGSICGRNEENLTVQVKYGTSSAEDTGSSSSLVVNLQEYRIDYNLFGGGGSDTAGSGGDTDSSDVMPYFSADMTVEVTMGEQPLLTLAVASAAQRNWVWSHHGYGSSEANSTLTIAGYDAAHKPFQVTGNFTIDFDDARIP